MLARGGEAAERGSSSRNRAQIANSDIDNEPNAIPKAIPIANQTVAKPKHTKQQLQQQQQQ